MLSLLLFRIRLLVFIHSIAIMTVANYKSSINGDLVFQKTIRCARYRETMIIPVLVWSKYHPNDSGS